MFQGTVSRFRVPLPCAGQPGTQRSRMLTTLKARRYGCSARSVWRAGGARRARKVLREFVDDPLRAAVRPRLPASVLATHTHGPLCPPATHPLRTELPRPSREAAQSSRPAALSLPRILPRIRSLQAESNVQHGKMAVRPPQGILALLALFCLTLSASVHAARISNVLGERDGARTAGGRRNGLLRAARWQARGKAARQPRSRAWLASSTPPVF